MSDQGSTGGDIYLVPSNGGEPKDITPSREASPRLVLVGQLRHPRRRRSREGQVPSLRLRHPFTKGIFRVQTSPLPDTVRAGGLEMRIALSADSQSLAFIRSSFDTSARNLRRPAQRSEAGHPISTMESSRSGASPNRSSGRTKASTSRAGFSTPHSTIPRRSILSSSASTAAHRRP